jgi:hypothetical protein
MAPVLAQKMQENVFFSGRHVWWTLCTTKMHRWRCSLSGLTSHRCQRHHSSELASSKNANVFCTRIHPLDIKNSLRNRPSPILCWCPSFLFVNAGLRCSATPSQFLALFCKAGLNTRVTCPLGLHTVRVVRLLVVQVDAIDLQDHMFHGLAMPHE